MSQIQHCDQQAVMAYRRARARSVDLLLGEIEAFERLTSTQLDLLYRQELADLRRTMRRAKSARPIRSFIFMVLEGLALSSVPASATFTLTAAARFYPADPAPIYPFPWGFGYWRGMDPGPFRGASSPGDGSAEDDGFS